MNRQQQHVRGMQARVSRTRVPEKGHYVSHLLSEALPFLADEHERLVEGVRTLHRHPHRRVHKNVCMSMSR